MADFFDEDFIDVEGDGEGGEWKAEAGREARVVSEQLRTAGLRDGITAGKEAALQGGFDEGFAAGAVQGYATGVLRGLTKTLLQLEGEGRAGGGRLALSAAAALLDERAAAGAELSEQELSQVREALSAAGYGSLLAVAEDRAQGRAEGVGKASSAP